MLLSSVADRFAGDLQRLLRPWGKKNTRELRVLNCMPKAKSFIQVSLLLLPSCSHQSAPCEAAVCPLEISDDPYLCLVFFPEGRTVSGDLEIHVGTTNTTSEPKYPGKGIQQKPRPKTGWSFAGLYFQHFRGRGR